MKPSFDYIATTIHEYLNEQKISKDSIYDFKETPIEITEDNFKEAIYLRNKFSLFRNIGVGTFLTTTFLWRIVDEKEFNIILKTKKIIGGEYSVPPEKYFGASFGGSRSEVIEWGLKVKKSGRYKGGLYVIGINAIEKEFLNLNMVERLETQGFAYEIGDFTINSQLGDVGLGFSVRNVTLDDVRFIYELNDETNELKDITYDVI
jgi:hypothetical protein